MRLRTARDTAGQPRQKATRSISLKRLCIVTLLALGVLACTPADRSKTRAQEVINKGLIEQPECIIANVGRRHDPSMESTTLVLKALEAAKLIELGTIEEKSWMSNAVKVVPAYTFTDSGKALVSPNAAASLVARLPCVRNGRFEVASIEAIDINNDMAGRPIASVRAKLRFIAEDWFAATKTDPAWASYWSAMSKNEQTQWLYSLLKSGEELFYTGRATALK